jgi:hypothetical protein
VFAPEGGSFDVDLTATGGLLSVEWLHPTNGKSSIAETVAGGARRRFTAPAGEPVVLLLRNVFRFQTAPSEPGWSMRNLRIVVISRDGN